MSQLEQNLVFFFYIRSFVVTQRQTLLQFPSFWEKLKPREAGITKKCRFGLLPSLQLSTVLGSSTSKQVFNKWILKHFFLPYKIIFLTHQYNQNYHGNLIKFKLKKKNISQYEQKFSVRISNCSIKFRNEKYVYVWRNYICKQITFIYKWEQEAPIYMLAKKVCKSLKILFKIIGNLCLYVIRQ